MVPPNEARTTSAPDNLARPAGPPAARSGAVRPANVPAAPLLSSEACAEDGLEAGGRTSPGGQQGLVVADE